MGPPTERGPPVARQRLLWRWSLHFIIYYDLHLIVPAGYWSSGTRLADSARISGDGIELGDLPEYMVGIYHSFDYLVFNSPQCGGAQTRARPSSFRRRRHVSQKRGETVPSLHTGRQTAKRRKAGGRVTSKFAFVGDGRSLADDSAQSSKGKRAAR